MHSSTRATPPSACTPDLTRPIPTVLPSAATHPCCPQRCLPLTQSLPPYAPHTGWSRACRRTLARRACRKDGYDPKQTQPRPVPGPSRGGQGTPSSKGWWRKVGKRESERERVCVCTVVCFDAVRDDIRRFPRYAIVAHLHAPITEESRARSTPHVLASTWNTRMRAQMFAISAHAP